MRLPMTLPFGARLAVLLLMATTLRGDCPDLSRAKSSTPDMHVGRFYDAYWGFSVRIPKGLRGYSDPAPNPMHGIDIPISDNHRAVVYLLAYDKPLDTRMTTIDEDQLRVLRSSGSLARVSGPARSRVSGLFAASYDVTYNCGANDPLTETFLLLENPNHRVFYRIGLYSPKSRRHTDEKLFRKILSTWRAHAIRAE